MSEMVSPLRILHLEDNPSDAKLVEVSLASDGLSVQVEIVVTRPEFQAAIERGGFDLILADHSLPSFDALAALQMVRQAELDVPFILVSGTIGEESAVEAMRSGATDYILKSRMSKLAVSVRRALREAEERRERQRMEMALRQSEARYRTLVESVPEVIYRVAADGALIELSPAFESITGWPRAEWLGRPFAGLVHPEDLPAAVARFEDVMRGQTPAPYELRLRTRSGDYLVGEFTSAPIVEAGRVVGKSGVARDITERKRAESERAWLLSREQAARAQAEAERRRYQDLVEGIEGGIVWEADPETLRFSYVSSRAEALLGYPLDAWRSDSGFWLRHVHPDDREKVAAAFRRARESTGGTCEHRLLAADGRSVWFQTRVRVATDAVGAPVLRGLSADITAQRKVEAELLKASKLDSIGVLAGGIAHDFNNLLAAILANLSLVKRRLDPEDRAYQRVTEAEKATLRARDITQQLLTFAKGGTPLRRVTAIGELIQDAAHFALHGSNVLAEFDIAPDLWPVDADEGQLGQVIQNLTLNALQAMAQGGSVHIQADNVVLRGDEGIPLPLGEYLRIQVTDHGTGIRPEHLPNIFDPFFTTKPQGSGLGLATSYSIIQKHDGHIAVRSEWGVGTTFTIHLPASRSGVPDARAVEMRLLSGHGHVLVMDDEASVRETVCEVLTELGYDTAVARDGAEALALFSEARAAGRPFDVVILDLTVPGGQGGGEVMDHLRALQPDIRAIVSSGYANDPVMADYRRYGFAGVVVKPYTVQELSQVLHRVISSSDGA